MSNSTHARDQLICFLNREFLMLTIQGTLGRNPTYAKSANDKDRDSVRKTLGEYLVSMGEIYIDGNVNDSIHLSNIVALSSRIKNEHGAILTGGSFRIGAAQKALNLYLKYRWARNLIKAPPHCPIDRVIIDEIKKRDPNRCSCSICKTTMWTKMDNIEEYEHLIERARSAAGNEGYDLPHWELKIWQEQIQKSNRKSQKLNPVS